MVRPNVRTTTTGFALVCGLAIAAWSPGFAQQTPSSDAAPSPFAPGDLKRPIFDTTRPAYATAEQKGDRGNTVIAEVDGRAVTLGEVGDAIAELPTTIRNLPFPDLFPGIQAQLIRQQALVIRAQRQALDEDPGVRRKLKAAADRVLANALLEHEASGKITEAALLQRYNQDIATKPGPEEAHVRVIMTDTEQQAAAIIKEIAGGADFAAVAKRVSKDTTAPAGGDAGFLTRDGLTPEVGAVVFSMPAGQVTAYPVRSVGAWFVLKVEERRRQGAPPFTVAKDALRQTMMREGVGDVITAALSAVSVREYDFTGRETTASVANNGAH